MQIHDNNKSQCRVIGLRHCFYIVLFGFFTYITRLYSCIICGRMFSIAFSMVKTKYYCHTKWCGQKHAYLYHTHNHCNQSIGCFSLYKYSAVLVLFCITLYAIFTWEIKQISVLMNIHSNTTNTSNKLDSMSIEMVVNNIAFIYFYNVFIKTTKLLFSKLQLFSFFSDNVNILSAVVTISKEVCMNLEQLLRTHHRE